MECLSTQGIGIPLTFGRGCEEFNSRIYYKSTILTKGRFEKGSCFKQRGFFYKSLLSAVSKRNKKKSPIYEISLDNMQNTRYTCSTPTERKKRIYIIRVF